MLPRQALCGLGNGTGDVKIISDVLQDHPIPAPRQYEIRQFGLYEEHLRLLSQRSHSEIECDVANGPLTVNLGYRSLASCIERQCTYDRSNDAHRNSIRGVCRKFSFESQDQAESDLIALLRPNYKRTDQEGQTLLHELFAAEGDIRVSDAELNITLAPLSSPHRTQAAQALCEALDKTATIFPGSRLRMRVSVRPPPRIGMAFPGSPPDRNQVTPTDRP